MGDLLRVKANLKSMISQGAPEADLDGYIASEGFSLDEITGKMPVLEAATGNEGKILPKNPFPVGTTFTGEKAQKKGFDPFTAFGASKMGEIGPAPYVSNPIFMGVSELLSRLPRLSETGVGKAIVSTPSPEDARLAEEAAKLEEGNVFATPKEDIQAGLEKGTQARTKLFLDSLQTLGEFAAAGKVESKVSQTLVNDAIKRIGGKLVQAGYTEEAAAFPYKKIDLGEGKELRVHLPQDVVDEIGKYTPTGQALLQNLQSRRFRLDPKGALTMLPGPEAVAAAPGLPVFPTNPEGVTSGPGFEARAVNPFESKVGDIRKTIEDEIVKAYYASKGLTAGEGFVTQPVRSAPGQQLPFGGNPQTPEEFAKEEAAYQNWLKNKEPTQRPELNQPLHPAPAVSTGEEFQPIETPNVQVFPQAAPEPSVGINAVTGGMPETIPEKPSVFPSNIQENEKVDLTQFPTVYYDDREWKLVSQYKNNVLLWPADQEMFRDQGGIERSSATEKNKLTGIWVDKSEPVVTPPAVIKPHRKVQETEEIDEEGNPVEESEQAIVSSEIVSDIPVVDMTSEEFGRNMDKKTYKYTDKEGIQWEQLAALWKENVNSIPTDEYYSGLVKKALSEGRSLRLVRLLDRTNKKGLYKNYQGEWQKEPVYVYHLQQSKKEAPFVKAMKEKGATPEQIAAVKQTVTKIGDDIKKEVARMDEAKINVAIKKNGGRPGGKDVFPRPVELEGKKGLLPIATPNNPFLDPKFNEVRLVEGHPEIYHDKRLLLVDRSLEEIKKWGEKKISKVKVSYDDVLQVLPKVPGEPFPKTPFIRYTENSGEQAIFRVGVNYITVNAKLFNWLKKEGYQLTYDPKGFVGTEYQKPIPLVRGGKIAGVTLPMRLDIPSEENAQFVQDLAAQQELGKPVLDYTQEDMGKGGHLPPREPGEPRHLLVKQEKEQLLKKIDEAIIKAPATPEDRKPNEPEQVSIQIGAWNLKIGNSRKALNEFKSIVNKRGTLDVRFLAPMVDLIEKYLMRGGNVSPEVFRAYQKRLNEISGDLFDSILTTHELKKALARYPDEIGQQAVKVATGQLAVESLPAELQTIVGKVRKDLDRLSMKFLKYGAYGPKLEEIISGNIGKYIARRYKIFEQKNYQPKPEDIQAATDYLRAQPEFANLDDDQVKGVIDSLVFAKKHGFTIPARKKVLRIPQAHFMKRKDIPPEIRALYGEADDLPYLYQSTMADLSVIANTAETLSNLADMGQLMLDTPQGDKICRLPDSAAYGKLAGKYTDEETYNLITELIGPKARNHFMTLIDNFITQPFKWTHTVGNIPTHPRNFLGNLVFAVMAKNSISNPMNAGFYRDAADILLRRAGKHRKTWESLVRLGVVEVELMGGEMNRYLERLLTDAQDIGIDKAITLSWQHPIASLGLIYNAGDQIFKVSTFLKAVEKWKMSPEEAAKFIDESYPNFRDVPKATRVLRDIPVLGRFVSFKSEAMRIMAQKTARGFKEASEGNPYLAIAIPILLAAPYILRAAMAKKDNIDLNEAEKLQEISPSWRRNVPLIYYRDADGNLKAFDVSYILPWGDPQQAALGILKGDLSYFKDLFFSDPSLDILDLIKDGQNAQGQKISNELDSLLGSWMLYAKEIFTRYYAPSYWGIQSIMNAGTIDKYGRQRNVPEELRSFLSGVRTFKIYPEVVVDKYITKIDFALQEKERNLDAWIMEHPKATDKDIDAQAKIMDKYYNSYMEKIAQTASIDVGKLSPIPGTHKK